MFTTNMNQQQSEGHGINTIDETKLSTDGTNLIVNYIPNTMSENELRALFSPFGNLIHCKIITDKHSRQSLGYGFIKYDDPNSAQNAIRALNGHQLQSKRLKVSVAKPPDALNKTNLYISGLPPHFTQRDLMDLVSQYGKVVESRVLLGETIENTHEDPQSRKCRGVGFARMETQKSALNAIAGLTGTQLDGGSYPLVVKFADTNSDKQRKLAQQYNALQFGSPRFGSLNGAAAAAAVAARGVPFDPYASSAAFYSPTLNSIAAAAHSLPPYASPQHHGQPQPLPASQGQQAFPQNGANGQAFFGQQREKEQFSGICLFVYHLPPDATEHSLFQLFSNYGVVTSAKVMRDMQTGRNKGFGFVNMASQQQAEAALQALDGFPMGNKFLKVSFKSDKVPKM